MSDDLFWVGVLAWLVGVLGSAVGIFFGVAASGKADSNSRSKLLTMLHLSVVACFFGVLLAFNGLLMASKSYQESGGSSGFLAAVMLFFFAVVIVLPVVIMIISRRELRKLR